MDLAGCDLGWGGERRCCDLGGDYEAVVSGSVICLDLCLSRFSAEFGSSVEFGSDPCDFEPPLTKPIPAS
jgi:hypothetical protein